MIKIGFCDFWQGFDREGFILTKALREHHEVQIVANPSEADYVFFSVFGDQHWFLPDRCIKIFYTGENVCPDFNACDYAVGFEWLEFGDRYLRLPNYYCTPFFLKSTLQMEQEHKRRVEASLGSEGASASFTNDTLQTLVHRKFCSFVVSQNSGNQARFDIYNKLSEYKKVDSGGRWQNSVGGPVKDKLLFQKQYKFVIAGENASHSGYTTEKLIEAFASCSIPVYWGDPEVDKVFNPNAFINANRYKNGADLLDEVIRLDSDDDLYLSMLNQPILLHPDRDLFTNIYKDVVNWMDLIATRSIENNYRRCRDEWATKYIQNHINQIQVGKKTWLQLLVESIKQKL